MQTVTKPSTKREVKPSSGLVKVKTFLANNGALVGLVILAIVLSLASPVFLSVNNITQIGVQTAVTAILAFGMTFVIVAAGIDLSLIHI